MTDNVLGGIGNTPLVQLANVVPPGSARVVAKLEWANPTGTHIGLGRAGQGQT